MKPACPRLFEAEALRDGRLVGAELSNFERHLSMCPHCSREVEALQALGDALRDTGLGPARAGGQHGEAGADELHIRRERTRLLAAFDAALVPPERKYGARSVLLGFAAVAAILVGLFVYFGPRAGAPDVGTGPVVVHADSDASWSRRSDGSLEKIVLERGALSIRVDPALALDHRRLLVVLPDGELEDIGTTFTVSADAGRTTRVSVQSGSVVLRLRGQPPLALGAGDTWTPSPPAAPSASACKSCEPASLSAPSASPLSSAPARRVPASSVPAHSTPRPKPSASHGASQSASHGASESVSHSATRAEPEGARDFRAAMAALDRGDNATAAARFADFLAAHPGDARAEDAAYLRIIALQRANNTGSMKEAAAQYLRRYPKGFRRAEVETLSR
jgi:hypothetical protein